MPTVAISGRIAAPPAPRCRGDSAARHRRKRLGGDQLCRPALPPETNKDFGGPLHVAMAATKAVTATENKLGDQGRLVVFGDSDWISNKYYDLQGNTDLMLNTVNWFDRAGRAHLHPHQEPDRESVASDR